MAQIKVIYKGATTGLDTEHSEANDSIKMMAFLTANKTLTDAKLAHLIDGADAADEHIHDARYFRQNQYLGTSAGVTSAASPIKTDANGKIDLSFINVTTLNPVLSHSVLQNLGNDDHPQYLKTDGTRPLTGVQSYATVPSITADTQLPSKKYVDDLVAASIKGQEWWYSVLTRTVTPPATPATGARYLIDGTIGSPTGVWAGHTNQVAEWNGSAYTYQTPTTGTFVDADDMSSGIYYFNGTAWSFKSFEATTASTGIVKVGNDIQLDPNAAGNGLGYSAGVMNVNVDGTTLEINNDIVRVKAAGISAAQVNYGTGAGQVNASVLPILDSGNYYATKNVEAALQFVGSELIYRGTNYTVGTGGVTKGDLVYLTANDTVVRYGTLTNDVYVIGTAMATVAAGGSVKVLSNDVILTGVLSSATVGTRYYWNGSTLQTTIPSTSGQNVWSAGIAKNATDLTLEVMHVKKNA